MKKSLYIKVNYYNFLSRKIDILNKSAENYKDDKDKLKKIYADTDRFTDIQRRVYSEIEKLQKQMI